MTRTTFIPLLLGVSLCFASASIAYDRHVVSAALAVGPASISFDHEAGPAPSKRANGASLGFHVAWRTDAQQSLAANVAAALSVEVERAKWM